jgi:hypothetical protein
MRTALSISALFLFCSLHGQRILPGIVASSVASAPAEDYVILYQWDFENWSAPEEYDAADVGVDFNTTTEHANVDWGGGDSIVVDTINGEATQVLKIVNDAGQIQEGLQGRVFFDAEATGYDSLNFTYNVKFDPGFEAVSSNGKIFSLWNLPTPGSTPCPPTDPALGWVNGYLYKAGLGFSDYNYSRNIGVSCPWTIDQYGPRYLLDDSTYFIPGVWYCITQRLHLNTISGGANPDGIMETWVYDDMIFQIDSLRLTASDTMKIDAIGLRSFQSWPSTTKESTIKFDNLTIWVPTNDANFDNGTAHASSYKMVTPVDITDSEVWYESDHFITTETTFSTEGYPSSTDPGHHEAWLMDAGAGNTMTATFLAGQTGGSDYVFFIDGNDAEDPILDWEPGSDGDLTNSFGGDGAVTSTGRYLYLYTVNSEDIGFTEFQVQTTINE